METKYDFSGYVTKNDILCSDGRTIRQNAFLENDGKIVPMVWMHRHDSPDNVLGHVLLENRPDGVYGYGFFNDTPKAQTAKALVQHGDISCMSIFANQLKQRAGDVIHGLITEVSLVLSGANRGALIDSRMAHGEFSDEEAVICMGDTVDPIEVNEEGDTLAHYGRKGMKWGESIFQTEIEGSGNAVNTNETHAPKKPSVLQNVNDFAIDTFPETIRKKIQEHQEKMDEATTALESLNENLINMDADEKAKVYASSKIQGLISTIKDELNAAYDLIIPASEKGKAEGKNQWTVEDRLMENVAVDQWIRSIFGDEIVDGSGQDKPDFKSAQISEEKADHPKSREKNITGEGKPIERRESINAKELSVLKNVGGYPEEIQKEANEHGKKLNDAMNLLAPIAEKIMSMRSQEEKNKAYKTSKIKELVNTIFDEVNAIYDLLIPASENEQVKDTNKLTEDDRTNDYTAIYEYLMTVFGTEALGYKPQEERSMEHSDKDRTIEEVLNEMTDEQRDVVFYLLAKVEQENKNMKHSEEDETVKNNVFEQSEEQTATLSHADITAIFDEAKRNHGSLKDTFLAHSAEYGIENIEYLFPDDRQLTSAPVFIKKPDEWVKNVMANISHTPFARVRSVFADITEADARAKGYVKGNRKTEEVITLLKRKTDPTTIYKKQKLDRDDQVDITDLNIASWLKTEMRMKLDEEIAQGILIGDLRNPASDDKIDEQKLRPIWKDDDLFVIRKALPLSANMTPDDRARKFIRMAVKARKDYRGKGNPTLYTTEDLLTDMLMIEDTTGRPLYDSEAKLCTALRVKEIVAVPSMENVSRIVGTSTMNLMGIIVNLADYNVGADKGGSIEMFEDFDIDFNQNKYLIETRISGALTAPYSAIVIEGSESMYLDTDPEDPTTTLFGKNVSDLQSNLIINEDSIAGTLKYVTGYTGYSGDPELQKGNFLALKFSAPDSATTTVELLGGHSAPVTLDSDMNAVFRIENRNQKVKVVSAVDGMEIAKVYSLRLLKLNGPNA